MSNRAKLINVLLMDGEANGRVKATISNWIGVVYKIPRGKLSLCKGRDDLNQSSVYFLFGNPSHKKKDAVYIGQAGIRKNGGGILARLLEHDKNPEKDYWTDAVVITTSNNSLGPTELSFLENRFCNMAIQAGRYEVKNANDPTPGNITEEKESELDEFANFAELILGVLGYKVFEAPAEIGEEAVFNHTSNKKELPSLPNKDGMKIGQYVRTAMRALSQSGYEFTEEQINQMCTKEWSVEHFHTEKVFMRKYVEGETSTKDEKTGQVRFWSEVFVFGKYAVLISKEWYQNHFDLFDAWYAGL